jgi:hypothetical protein
MVLFVPNRRTAPPPVFVFINNRDREMIDATRKVRDDFWPAEQIVARGYAAAAFQHDDAAPDNKEHWREGVIGLFEDAAADVNARPADSWGAVAAWAWAASRCVDYLETDPDVDAKRVAVVGHSRGGKAALCAGMNDERFGLVVSNDSGTGGAALARRGLGEGIERINAAFPFWFCRNYRQYGGKPGAMPVDQHLLIAAIAPRAVYVSSADEDLWADPRGEFTSLSLADDAFRLFDDPAIEPSAMPGLERPLTVGRRGYHIRRGGHDLIQSDWARFMDFADRLWAQ